MCEIFPAETSQLHGLPDWKVADLSWFLHGRPDRFAFSSMWGCLFHDAVDTQYEAKALELVEAGAYVAQAVKLRRRTGVEHHPANVFAELLREA